MKIYFKYERKNKNIQGLQGGRARARRAQVRAAVRSIEARVRNSNKIRVLFSASPAPRGGGARALQAPYRGNKTFILLNCFVCLRRASPRFALVRHGRPLCAGQPPACRRTPQSLGGAYRSQLHRGFPPTAAAPRVSRHSRGALPHGRVSVDHLPDSRFPSYRIPCTKQV